MIEVDKNNYAGTGDAYKSAAVAEGSYYQDMETGLVSQYVGGEWIVGRSSAETPITDRYTISAGVDKTIYFVPPFDDIPNISFECYRVGNRNMDARPFFKQVAKDKIVVSSTENVTFEFTASPRQDRYAQSEYVPEIYQ